MAMDGLNLAASVAECRRIVGGRIDKIQRPKRTSLQSACAAAAKTSGCS